MYVNDAVQSLETTSFLEHVYRADIAGGRRAVITEGWCPCPCVCVEIHVDENWRDEQVRMNERSSHDERARAKETDRQAAAAAVVVGCLTSTSAA